MNTIQHNAVLPTNTGNVADAAHDAHKISGQQSEKLVLTSDHYSATAANDAVVAKVLSNNLGKRFAHSGEQSSANPSLAQKLATDNAQSAQQFNIESVTSNIVGFVESSLANMASRGYDSKQLDYFRGEAIKGVEVGIDQAKLELVAMATDETYQLIDDTKTNIISNIKNLPTEPHEYKITSEVDSKIVSGTQREFAAIDVNTKNQSKAIMNFEARAFNHSQNAFLNNIYTTSTSNISFSIAGDLTETDASGLAQFTNKVDSLANAFYRSNVQDAYEQSINKGYNDNSLISLAMQLQKSENQQQVKLYDDVKYSNVGEQKENGQAPKVVAQYINKYLDVIETSKNTVESEKDFNQVINGLVNQMKDVQVPDLLQAINRFHAFNNKFS